MAKEEVKKGLMGSGDDYHIYQMNLQERLVGIVAAFAAGAVVGYIFFANPVIAVIVGMIAAIKLQKPYRKFLHDRRMKKLLLEFKDLLETLSASYSAGLTTTGAFADAYKEMEELYGTDSDIVRELLIINTGLQHSYNIEDLLLNFAERSGLDDVNSFANVFDICNRKGGNLKQIVGETRSIINDKIDMEMEIQTMVAASKNELNIMMVMPLIIMVSMKGLGDSMAENGLIYLCAKIAALGIFAGAYILGAKLTDIKL